MLFPGVACWGVSRCFAWVCVFGMNVRRGKYTASRSLDSCSAEPISFEVWSGQGWGGRFFVFLCISFRVERIVEAMRSKSSLKDFRMFPYFSFQEWYDCWVGCWWSGKWLLPREGWEGRRKEIKMLWLVRTGYLLPGVSSMDGWMGGRECQQLKWVAHCVTWGVMSLETMK